MQQSQTGKWKKTEQSTISEIEEKVKGPCCCCCCCFLCACLFSLLCFLSNSFCSTCGGSWKPEKKNCEVKPSVWRCPPRPRRQSWDLFGRRLLRRCGSRVGVICTWTGCRSPGQTPAPVGPCRKLGCSKIFSGCPWRNRSLHRSFCSICNCGLDPRFCTPTTKFDMEELKNVLKLGQ